MTIQRMWRVMPALFILLSCMALPVWADRDGDDDRGRRVPLPRPSAEQGQKFRAAEPQEDRRRANEQHESQRRDGMHRNGGIKAPPGYVLDSRYRHDRYYPPRGHTIKTLPSDHRVIHHHGIKYHYHDGVWYRYTGIYYVVVLPPFGLMVPFLPPFYTTIWVGGIPYYYADDVYYVWRPEQSAYIVAEPPPASEVSEEPASPDQLYVYPAKGQSEQQMATDRYQCHRWAVDQTGFDPTQPGGNVPAGQVSGKRADYQRAMKACLEARGYSVQ